MQELINFIDLYTLDSRLYLQVPQLYSKNRVEIMWMGNRLWRLRESDGAFWLEVDSEYLIEALKDVKADLDEVEKNLLNIAIEQIVGANFILKAGRNYFGDELVDDAILQYEEFQKELISSIDDAIEEKEKENKKAKLSLVQNVDKKE